MLGIRQYFSWNDARWEAIGWLTEEQRVEHARIDGGVEFGGWYLYDPGYVQTPDKSWWWVPNDEYLLSLGSAPPTHERVRTFVGPETGFGPRPEVHVYRRRSPG